MRISDWSSDVCSSDLVDATGAIADIPDSFRQSTHHPRQLEADQQAAKVLALVQFHVAAVDLDHIAHDRKPETGAGLARIEPRAAIEDEIGKAAGRERVWQ